MITVRFSSLSRRALLAATCGAALGVSGCSSPAPTEGTTDPGLGKLPFTSDTGAVTLTVPAAWDDFTAEARDAAEFPGMTVEGAWIVAGTAGVDGSSFVIVTYDASDMTTAQFADQGSTAVEAMYPTGDVVKTGSFTGDGGIEYERQDIRVAAPPPRVYQVELWSVTDGVGIEIAITLVDDGDALLDDALDAARSLTLG